MANIAPKAEKEPADAGTQLLQKYELADDQEPEPVPVAATAESVAVPVETPTPPANKHPVWLAKKAKMAGMDDQEIGELGSDDLKDALLVLGESRRDMQQAGPARDPQTGQFVKPQEAAPVAEPEFSLKDLGIDEKRLEIFDPEFSKILSDVTKPLLDRIKKLESGLGEFDKRDQARARDAHFDKLDQLFNENDTYFGKGSRSKLTKGSPEMIRRQAVINGMAAAFQTDPSLSFEENFEKVSKALTGSTPAPAAKPTSPPPAPKVDPDPKGYMNGQTVKPSNRQTKPEPKGHSAAVAAVADWRKSFVPAESTEEEDDLPG